MKIPFRRRAAFGMFAILIACSCPVLMSCESDDDGPEKPGQEEENEEPEFGTLTDDYGNTYTTVVLGGQEWMAENLRTVNITGLANCYDGEVENCDLFG